MIWTVLCISTLLKVCYITSSSALSIFRGYCFDNIEKDCAENFTYVYPDLSTSSSNQLADTYFLLFTRKNPYEPEKLHKCGGRLPPNSNFNPKKRLILLCLPYLTNWCNINVFSVWKDELLKKEDCNVLAIDYDWTGLNYFNAPDNVKFVAKQTVVVLKNIQEETGIKNQHIMAVGMSLGAQLAGSIGKEFYLERIIGLDPAGPLFRGNEVPNDFKLNRSDAKFVEVWHCCAGSNYPPWLGTNEDLGHVNYYINGGSIQKMCIKEAKKALFSGDILFGLDSILLEHSCYHLQCSKYFQYSINNEDCQLVGIKCSSYEDFKAGNCTKCGPDGENCLTMSFNTDKIIKEIPKEPVIYYLDTTDLSPYCNNNSIELEGFRTAYNLILNEKKYWTWIPWILYDLFF